MHNTVTHSRHWRLWLGLAAYLVVASTLFVIFARDWSGAHVSVPHAIFMSASLLVMGPIVVVFAGAVGGWIVGFISSMLPVDYEFPERFPRLSMGLNILVGVLIFGVAFWVLSFIPSSGTDEEYDPLPWHWR